MVVKFN